MQTTSKELLGFTFVGAIGLSMLGTFVCTAYWMFRDDFLSMALSIFVPFFGAISVAADQLM